MHNRRIDACATVDSTPVQSFIRRLHNHQINTCATVAYAIVDSTLVKKSLFCFARERNIATINIDLFFEKKLLQYFFQYFTDWYFCKYNKGDGLTKQNLNFKLDRIFRLYSKHKGLIFLLLTPKILCKNYMKNSSYTFSFLAGIINLFNMVLTNRDEVIQRHE